MPSRLIRVAVHGPDALTLRYTLTMDKVARNVAERLMLVKTACAYGGARQWFACPWCTRRVAVLNLRRGYFACRCFQRVAYSSQSEDDIDRLWRKRNKIEGRLGGHWRQPKGIRQHTYDRLVSALVNCEEQGGHAFALALSRLKGLAGG